MRGHDGDRIGIVSKSFTLISIASLAMASLAAPALSTGTQNQPIPEKLPQSRHRERRNPTRKPLRRRRRAVGKRVKAALQKVNPLRLLRDARIRAVGLSLCKDWERGETRDREVDDLNHIAWRLKGWMGNRHLHRVQSGAAVRMPINRRRATRSGKSGNSTNCDITSSARPPRKPSTPSRGSPTIHPPRELRWDKDRVVLLTVEFYPKQIKRAGGAQCSSSSCLDQGDIGSLLAVGADELLPTCDVDGPGVTGPSDLCPIVICLIMTNG